MLDIQDYNIFPSKSKDLHSTGWLVYQRSSGASGNSYLCSLFYQHFN